MCSVAFRKNLPKSGPCVARLRIALPLLLSSSGILSGANFRTHCHEPIERAIRPYDAYGCGVSCTLSGDPFLARLRDGQLDLSSLRCLEPPAGAFHVLACALRESLLSALDLFDGSPKRRSARLWPRRYSCAHGDDTRPSVGDVYHRGAI